MTKDLTEKVFTDIYRKNIWGGMASASGTGSSLRRTKVLIERLPVLFREFNISSILDIPCGDFHWMNNLSLEGTRYVGADIVKEIIQKNSSMHEKENVRFQHLDLITDKLPEVDLILCRDCLVHFSYNNIVSALMNICNSGAKYLLTTTFTERTENCDINTGAWRPLNLLIPPFNLSPPVRMINEECSETYATYSDKSLGLWKVQEVKESLTRLLQIRHELAGIGRNDPCRCGSGKKFKKCCGFIA